MENPTGEAEVKQGETSAEQKQTSIEETPEFKKALSDHLAKAGREAKSLEAQKQEIEQKRQELAEWENQRKQAESEREMKELEAAANDPDATESDKKNIVRARDYLKKQIEAAKAEEKKLAEIRKELAENEPIINEIKQTKFMKAVTDYAGEVKVDIDELKKIIESRGIKDIEQAKLVADVMPKVQPKEAPKPDSGKGMGGSGKPSITAMSGKDLMVLTKKYKMSAMELIQAGLASP